MLYRSVVVDESNVKRRGEFSALISSGSTAVWARTDGGTAVQRLITHSSKNLTVVGFVKKIDTGDTTHSLH